MRKRQGGLTRAGDSQFLQRLLPKPKSERQLELMKASADELTAISGKRPATLKDVQQCLPLGTYADWLGSAQDEELPAGV